MILSNTAEYKRAGIFYFNSKDGLLHDYEVYLLQNMCSNLDELIIVSNREVKKIEFTEIVKYSTLIYTIDENADKISAWKKVIEKYFLNKEKLGHFHELVLFDNSIYGPFYPVKKVFDEMDKRDVDLWGITNQYETFVSGGLTGRGHIVPEHLENYFIAFRGSLLQSEHFAAFWNRIPADLESEAYEEYAVKLTSEFTELGYKAEPYVDLAEYKMKPKDSISYSLYMPDYLIKHKAMPFLRRDVFTLDYLEFIKFIGCEMFSSCLKYIDQHTEYNLDWILDDIIRSNNITDVKQKLSANFVPSSEYDELHSFEGEAAVIIHVYYMDLLEEIYRYACHIPEYMDLYITTGNEKNIRLIKEQFAGIRCRKFEVIKVENRGRDLAALLVGCREIVKKYKYVCFTHDKKSSGNAGSLVIGKSFMHTIIENVLSNRIYINNIINLFEKNKYLGVIAPPGPVHNIYFASIGREWTACMEQTGKVLELLGIDNQLDADKQPFVLGSSFWFRTDALLPLFEHEFKHEDFPEEPMNVDGTFSHGVERCFPYVAQSRGYYSGWVMTEDYAAVETTNKSYLLSEIVGTIQKRYEPYAELYYENFLKRLLTYGKMITSDLYVDTGNGYSEFEKLIGYIAVDEKGNGNVLFDLRQIEKECLSYRLDPVEAAGSIIYYDSVKLNGKEVYDWKDNGIELSSNGRMYLNTFPQLIIGGSREKGRSLEIKLRVQEVESGLLELLTDKMNFIETRLFYDLGDGFSEAGSISKSVLTDSKGEFRVEYNVDGKGQIKSIRFDPNEGHKVFVKIHRILCDGIAVEIGGHNGIMQDNGYILFDTEDPWIAASKEWEELKKIVIEGCVFNADAVEVKKDEHLIMNTCLFYDLGDGFSEVDCVRQPVLKDAQGEFKVEYEVDLTDQNEIKSIRFDPNEGHKVFVKIHRILCDEMAVEIEDHNGKMQNNGYILFDTQDPWLTVSKAWEQLKKVVIEGCVLNADAVEVREEEPPAPEQIINTGLFYDLGDGFSEVNSIRKPVLKDNQGEFKVEYEIELTGQNEIKSIRFDPDEGHKAFVKIRRIICNDEAVEIDEHNGIMQDKGYILFDTEDPWLVISRQFQDLKKVVIEGCIFNINIDEQVFNTSIAKEENNE